MTWVLVALNLESTATFFLLSLFLSHRRSWTSSVSFMTKNLLVCNKIPQSTDIGLGVASSTDDFKIVVIYYWEECGVHDIDHRLVRLAGWGL